MRTSAYAAVGLSALVLGAAGCGSDDNGDDNAASTPASTPAAPTDTSSSTSNPATAGGASTVKIGESEYKLTPAAATAKAGSVTIEASNDGKIPHNLEIEGNGVEKEIETIQPGASGKLTLDLKPGKYEMYCSIDGHKDLGMKGDITVS